MLKITEKKYNHLRESMRETLAKISEPVSVCPRSSAYML